MSLNLCSDIQIEGSEFGVKQHESMDSFCLVSRVQADAGGVMVWGIYSWHTFGPLISIKYCLNTTVWTRRNVFSSLLNLY